jgi:hypothetical protein
VIGAGYQFSRKQKSVRARNFTSSPRTAGMVELSEILIAELRLRLKAEVQGQQYQAEQKRYGHGERHAMSKIPAQ